MSGQDNFGYLGYNFQIKLLNNILIDKNFGKNIVEHINPKYFDNQYFKFIMQMIKEYYNKYSTIPSFEALEQVTLLEQSSDMATKNIGDMLIEIKNIPMEDNAFVQEKSLKFCKQQELKKAIKKVNSIMEKGEFESYDLCEEYIRKATQIGEQDNSNIEVFENANDVMEKDFRHPIPTGINGIDNLLNGGLAKGELGLVLAPSGIGKCQPMSSKILTPNGWKKMGDITLGDEVMGSDGKKQYVIGVYPQGERKIFKVKFTDQTEVLCDAEHIWSVNTLNMRTAKTRLKGKSIRKSNFGYKNILTKDLIDIKKRGIYNYRLPTMLPSEFNNIELPINPYVLGILLGDGCFSNNMIQFVTKDNEIINNIDKLCDCEITNTSNSREFDHYNNDNTITKVKRNINIVSLKKYKVLIKELGLFGTLSNNKFIPKNYIYNSIDNRMQLLQGLMDSDGYISKKGIMDFTSVSKQLTDDVRELVLSLGGTVRMLNKTPKYKYKGILKEGQCCYIVRMSFPDNGIIPFKLTRKLERFKSRTHYKNQKFVKSVEYSHVEEAQCIKVSNADELYVTDDFVLTHNTTMLTKLANYAYNVGLNVLQIIFEDNPKVIQRKHYTIWSKISQNKLSDNRELVLAKVEEYKNRGGKLIIKKLPSDSLNIIQIKNQIRKMISEGFKPDIVVLDYIDCVLPVANSSASEWKNEGSIIRQFEAMSSELDFAGWVGVQGNRDSMSSDVVTSDQMGGSIKKAQVGHVIITIAKSLQQKELGLATMALVKSRIGKDGVVFENCIFNNDTMEISTDQSTTLLGYEKDAEEAEEEERNKRVKQLMDNK